MRIFLNHSSRNLNYLRYLQTAVCHRKPQVAAVTYKRKPQKISENWDKRVTLHILFKAYDVQFHNCVANVEVILTVEMYFHTCIQMPNSYSAIAVRRIYSYVGMSAGYAFVNLLNLFCNGLSFDLILILWKWRPIKAFIRHDGMSWHSASPREIYFFVI